MLAEWPCDALREPRFHTLAPILAALDCNTFPNSDALNALSNRYDLRNAKGLPLRFETQTVQTYERAVFETGAVPTRADNWHDLFNALAWFAFPLAKALLNRLHIQELAKQLSPMRSTARDALTVYDESGMVILCADGRLKALLRDFRWKELFWMQRDSVRQSMRFYVFGHALHEQLLRPYAGITAKAVIVDADIETLTLDPLAALALVDRAVCDYFEEPGAPRIARGFQPVPVLGIPDWWPENTQESYYEDTRYFRPGRRINKAPL
ncbi:MAG TPA: DUF3025 domain-containing protein [Burkholderiales bacterium]|jgi:hypothetical protein|nr:DUF3025 domain-containing protein [Burkholderiales bacterium]